MRSDEGGQSVRRAATSQFHVEEEGEEVSALVGHGLVRPVVVAPADGGVGEGDLAQGAARGLAAELAEALHEPVARDDTGACGVPQREVVGEALLEPDEVIGAADESAKPGVVELVGDGEACVG